MTPYQNVGGSPCRARQPPAGTVFSTVSESRRLHSSESRVANHGIVDRNSATEVRRVDSANVADWTATKTTSPSQPATLAPRFRRHQDERRSRIGALRH